MRVVDVINARGGSAVNPSVRRSSRSVRRAAQHQTVLRQELHQSDVHKYSSMQNCRGNDQKSTAADGKGGFNHLVYTHIESDRYVLFKRTEHVLSYNSYSIQERPA